MDDIFWFRDYKELPNWVKFIRWRSISSAVFSWESDLINPGLLTPLSLLNIFEEDEFAVSIFLFLFGGIGRGVGSVGVAEDDSKESRFFFGMAFYDSLLILDMPEVLDSTCLSGSFRAFIGYFVVETLESGFKISDYPIFPI